MTTRPRREHNFIGTTGNKQGVVRGDDFQITARAFDEEGNELDLTDHDDIRFVVERAEKDKVMVEKQLGSGIELDEDNNHVAFISLSGDDTDLPRRCYRHRFTITSSEHGDNTILFGDIEIL